MVVDAGAVVINLILACVLVLGWGVESWGVDGRCVGDSAGSMVPRRDVRRARAHAGQPRRVQHRPTLSLDAQLSAG